MQLIVDRLEIFNFKSIKHLEMPCRKVNIFIGEPNVGKSNILEAMAFFSPGILEDLKQVIRFKSMTDLYYDSQVEEKIVTMAGSFFFQLSLADSKFEGQISGTNH